MMDLTTVPRTKPPIAHYCRIVDCRMTMSKSRNSESMFDRFEACPSAALGGWVRLGVLRLNRRCNINHSYRRLDYS